MCRIRLLHTVQMADELELELEGEQNINKTQERITNLSSKVKETSQQRDDALAKAAEADAKVAAAEKERDFYAGFSGLAGKYPAATEFTDKIKEKVMSGYSPEDATVAVLNSEGRLSATPTPPAPLAPAAGGSASYTPPSQGDKSVGEMTRDEKRAKLVELESRGDISLT